MAYSFTCADTGIDCPGQFTSHGKDEVLEHVMMHTERVHADLLSNPELGPMVQTLIKQV